MELLATKRREPWTRATLAEALGTDVARVGRELGRMGVTLERRTSWEIAATTAASARTSCLAGLFLSASERCLVTCVSDGALDVGEGAVVTRDRLLAEALEPAEGLTLEDALWTAADHVADPGKRRPTTVAEFVASVAAALPTGPGNAVRAVALTADPPSWRGKAPVGLSWSQVADEAAWDAAAQSLLGQFGADAAPVLEGVSRLCGALLPTTDPFVWVRGATEAAARDDAATAAGVADAASDAAGPGDGGEGALAGAGPFATVEEALASICGAARGDGVDVCMLVITSSSDGIAWRHVTPPEPMPDAPASLDSAESVLASMDAAEQPLLLLRDEAGRLAAEMWLGASKKKTTRTA